MDWLCLSVFLQLDYWSFVVAAFLSLTTLGVLSSYLSFARFAAEFLIPLLVLVTEAYNRVRLIVSFLALLDWFVDKPLLWAV